MSYIYNSVFSSEFNSFLKMISDAGQQAYPYELTFKSLDIFLIENSCTEKKLDEAIINEWLDSKTCKAQTKNRQITHIRVFSRYLRAQKIPAYEPEYKIEHSDFIAYTFTDEEFMAIINSADNFSRNRRSSSHSSKAFPMLLRILYGCGLRIQEALELCWGDVDLDRGILHIKKAKNDKERDVPMNQSLTDILKLYKNRQAPKNADTDYLFESDRKPGTPYLQWTFRRWFLEILEQAGIQNERKEKFDRGISPHTLRHYFTYKSFLQAEGNGQTLEQIAPYLSAYLGHNSLIETEKYITTDYTLYKESQQRIEQSIGHVFPEVDFE